MTHRRLFLLLILLAIPLTASAKKKDPGPVLRADQPAGDSEQISAGAAAYTMCAACHGPTGEGQTGLAPRLNSQTFLSAASNEFITETIRTGRTGTNMVPWYGGLGDATLRNIVAYIRSWQTVDSAELNEAPLGGDATAGKRLFVDVCAACHGQTGAGYSAGVDGIGIGRKDFLANASNGFLRHMIRNGKSGTLMSSFSSDQAVGVDDLSDEQIDSVILFLRENAW